MTRGDLVTVVIPGDYGKPRPALIVQSDLFDRTDSVTVMLLTSTVVPASLGRLSLVPSVENGLRVHSEIMIDKLMSLRRDKVGRVIGRLDDDTMVRVNRSIALFFGLA